MKLTQLDRKFRADGIDYGFVRLDIEAAQRLATITVRVAEAASAKSAAEIVALGAAFWPLQ